jgi:hypothetical protein
MLSCLLLFLRYFSHSNVGIVIIIERRNYYLIVEKVYKENQNVRTKKGEVFGCGIFSGVEYFQVHEVFSRMAM